MRLYLCLFYIVFLFSEDLYAQANSYFQLTGKIGPYPVTFHLHKHRQELTGFYYYNAYQESISVSGKTIEATGGIELKAGNDEIFNLNSTATLWSGVWLKGSKKLSCFLNVSPISKSFQYVNTDGNIKAPAAKKSGSSSCEWSTIWPIGNTMFSNSVRQQLASSFPGLEKQDNTDDISALFVSLKKRYLQNYLKEMADVQPEVYAQSSVVDNRICFNTDKYLCIESNAYEYSGGAHGNTSVTYFNFSKISGKLLQLEDVFSADGLQIIPSIIELQYRKQHQLKPGKSLKQEGLLVDHITEPSGVFRLNKNGIYFIFNRYEIAPYASGIIEVFVPIQQIRSYLMIDYSSLF